MYEEEDEEPVPAALACLAFGCSALAADLPGSPAARRIASSW
jgi:hypothetical protein